jgi:hypothetical protein
MFEKLTTKKQLRIERAKNAKLLAKQSELEEALLEIASLLSKEVSNVEVIPK